MSQEQSAQSTPAGKAHMYRVPERANDLALGILLTGQAQPDTPAVDHFKRFARQMGIDLSQLWLAETHGEPRTAALMVPGEGRICMLMLAPIRREAVVPIQAELVRRMVGQLDPTKVHMVQALIEPQQTLVQASLRMAGLKDLATLGYMQRGNLPRQRIRLNLSDQDITVHHWRQTHAKRFVTAIEATYQQTLDCPGLLGLRQIEDVVAGHMAAGVFDPRLWFALYQGTQPVGVMLLNTLAGHQSVELVYLGLAPAFRGQGLATRLLSYGMDLCGSRGAQSMLLAVDERNEPALHLYHRMGFERTGRKVALIQSLVKNT